MLATQGASYDGINAGIIEIEKQAILRSFNREMALYCLST